MAQWHGHASLKLEEASSGSEICCMACGARSRIPRLLRLRLAIVTIIGWVFPHTRSVTRKIYGVRGSMGYQVYGVSTVTHTQVLKAYVHMVPWSMA